MGKKKRSSSTGSLKSFILLLLILGGGAYFYQNQQNLPEAKELTKELSHTLEKAQKEVAQRLPEKPQDEAESQPSANRISSKLEIPVMLCSGMSAGIGSWLKIVGVMYNNTLWVVVRIGVLAADVRSINLHCLSFCQANCAGAKPHSVFFSCSWLIALSATSSPLVRTIGTLNASFIIMFLFSTFYFSYIAYICIIN